MKKTRAVLVLLALTSVAAGGSYYWWQGQQSPLPPGIALGNGQIEAVQVDVSTRIPGRVSEILVKEGDLVQPGQVVAKIDTAQLRAQLLRAHAETARAESDVAIARAKIAQANAELVLAEKELKRTKELTDQGALSREAYDTRVASRDVANANIAAAEATLTARQRSVDAARATAQEIETQIADCVLHSSTVGRVLYRLAEPGEVLGSGGKVLTIVNLSEVYMEFFLPSSQAHRVEIGSEARIQLDMFSLVVPAKVTFVSPTSQFTPKQVETSAEREKLMFRIKVSVSQELVLANIEKVKTGVRGVAYVRLRGDAMPDWPEFLQRIGPPPPTALPTKDK